MLGLCLFVLLWFDLAFETFSLDTVLVPPIVSFVPTFVNAVYVAMGVRDRLRGLSRFVPLLVPLDRVISGSMLTALIGSHFIGPCHLFDTFIFV